MQLPSKSIGCAYRWLIDFIELLVVVVVVVVLAIVMVVEFEATLAAFLFVAPSSFISLGSIPDVLLITC